MRIAAEIILVVLNLVTFLCASAYCIADRPVEPEKPSPTYRVVAYLTVLTIIGDAVAFYVTRMR